MNGNINGSSPPVWLIDLDNLDDPCFPVLDPPLFGNLRSDDEHGSHAYANPVDHQVQSCKGDFSQGPDVVRCINQDFVEGDVEEKAFLYGAPNPVPCGLNSNFQVHSSGNDCPQNRDYNDGVLEYIRHILLDEDVEEADCMDGSHVASAASSKLYFDSNIVSSKSNSDVNPGSSNSNSDVCSSGVDRHEDLDFSDDVFKYINHILLEEGVEEITCALQDSEALRATERSLYEAISGQYPASPSDHLQNTDRLCETNQNYRGANLADSSTESSSSFEQVDDYSGRQTVTEMNKGVNDAKFLPDSDLVVCLSHDEQFPNECVGSSADPLVLMERDVRIEEFTNTARRKKNLHADAEAPDILVGRSSKQFAAHRESTLSDDVFDKVLVYREEKEDTALRQAMNEATKSSLRDDQFRKKGRKKREVKKNEVDLRTLLTQCAQAVAAEDSRSANEYLREIRKHASLVGDGMQRLAYYFADGLEARMAGAGTRIYAELIDRPVSGSDMLKAYHLYLATCPFGKTFNYFSNKTILNVAENVDSLHIVEFAALYGFQWPLFLQQISLRPGGPPRIRFTAIDFPCPGFRPSQRIQETGRRLASYAEKFNVPFEFNGFAQKWETITLEDINIRKGEVVVANCLFRFRYLLDDTVIADCPRDMVLNLIRKMNPKVFVFGILNGGYNTPFFLTRFREALFHFSTMYDFLDTIIPRDRHERMLLERVVLGRDAMNAIACEGAERIERPETYKQWQVRLVRAGLEMLPLNREILQTARSKFKLYHKDFMIDDDGQWMLEGWKGRAVYALSSWRPAS